MPEKTCSQGFDKTVLFVSNLIDRLMRIMFFLLSANNSKSLKLSKQKTVNKIYFYSYYKRKKKTKKYQLIKVMFIKKILFGKYNISTYFK